MTLPQFLSVAVLVGMMAMFLWGRFRYDVVAVMALLAAVVAGIVKPADAFRGFSDDIVIIVGSALVLSGAVQRSGARSSSALPLPSLFGGDLARRAQVRDQVAHLVAGERLQQALGHHGDR